MTERQLQFRVGLFVVTALVIGAVLILQFSEIKRYWQKSYALAVHFTEAPGIRSGSPVKQNGVSIGQVRKIVLDEFGGGVLALVDIHADRRLRKDTRPTLVRSLFGDARIEFSPGRSQELLPPNSRLEGASPVDPMQAVESLQKDLNVTLEAFTQTSREWQQVGENLNRLVETRKGNLDEVIERTALALETFTATMHTASATLQKAGATLDQTSSIVESANQLISDPKLQADLRATAAALPKMIEETQQTISAARSSMTLVTQNLDNLNQTTQPLAQHSDVIVRRLSGSLIQLESLLTELNQFSQVLNKSDGSLQKFAADPQLYENLNRSASSLSVLLKNLEPVLSDVRIFSDRIARHPELLGVSGAMNGSSGLKTESEIERAGYSTRGQ